MNLRFPVSRRALLLIISTLIMQSGHAGNGIDTRLKIGVNLFPAVLAANTRLNSMAPSEPIWVTIVYEKDKQTALQVLKLLSSRSRVKGHSLQIKIQTVQALTSSSPPQMAAALIAEPMEKSLARLIAFSRRHQVLLFSPYRGDVRKGVTAGFDVTDKVLPAVNRTALERANIRLKAFFMRIANQYD